jgi:hypothetical protein
MLNWSKNYAEQVPYTIEFATSLPTGETIDSVEVVALDSEGTDVSASLVGGTTIAGSKVSILFLPSGVGKYLVAVAIITAPSGLKITQDVDLLVKPNPDEIDLTTLDMVKQWAEVNSDSEDGSIQLCITAFSRYLLNRVGRATLGAEVELVEVYDGSGSAILYLHNYPVASLTFVLVNGFALPISSGYGIFGASIYGDRRNAIAIIQGSNGCSSNLAAMRNYTFPRGISNIQVSYKAGYGTVPADIEQAVREAVSINYKRKAWQDLASKSISAQGGTGTTSYRDWALPPAIERILNDYSRKTY